MSLELEKVSSRIAGSRILSKVRKLEGNKAQILALPATLWFILFLIIPILILVAYSFLTYQSFSVVYQLTLDPWLRIIRSDTILRVFTKTIFLGIIVTAITLLIGYPLAYFLRFYVGEMMGLVLLLFLVIPFLTSEMIRVVGWFPILGKEGVINWSLISMGVIDEPMRWLMFSQFSMLVGYLQNYIVFMAAPIYISLSQIDEDLLSASATLRANPISTFRNVTWPLSSPGVAIGCIFTFVLAIGNFAVPQYLGSGSSTISMLIFQSVNQGLNYPNAASLSILLLVVIFSMVLLLLQTVDILKISQN